MLSAAEEPRAHRRAGVGNTAIAEGSRRHVNGDVPESLSDSASSRHLGALIACASSAAVRERLKIVAEVITESKASSSSSSRDAQLVGAGKARPRGRRQMLKPSRARRAARRRATTSTSIASTSRRTRAPSAASAVYVGEPASRQIAILRGLKTLRGLTAAHHRLRRLRARRSRTVHRRPLPPDKAIDLLDQAAFASASRSTDAAGDRRGRGRIVHLRSSGSTPEENDAASVGDATPGARARRVRGARRACRRSGSRIRNALRRRPHHAGDARRASSDRRRAAATSFSRRSRLRPIPDLERAIRRGAALASSRAAAVPERVGADEDMRGRALWTGSPSPA